MGIAQAGVYLPFKQLLAGSGMTIVETATSITYSTTGAGPGGGDMLKSVYCPSNVSGKVDHAITADNLASGGTVPLAQAANSVPWGGITGLPASFNPSDYNQLLNKPQYFPTQWPPTGTPALFPPAIHGSTHLPSGSDSVPLASATAPGWLGMLSGNTNDYVGGDNKCHALPSTLGVPDGDLTPPADSTGISDEFTSTTLSSKWALTGNTGGNTGQLLQPTFYQFVMPQTRTAATTLALTQALTGIGAGFMFQTKLRFLLCTNSAATAGTDYSLEAGFYLLAPNKGIGIYVNCYTVGATAGPWFQANLGVWRGHNQSTQLTSTIMMMSGTDLRLRIGLQGANLVCQASTDAWNWLTIWQEPFSGNSLGGAYPTSLGLEMDDSGSANAGSAIVAWDYLRKTS